MNENKIIEQIDAAINSDDISDYDALTYLQRIETALQKRIETVKDRIQAEGV